MLGEYPTANTPEEQTSAKPRRLYVMIGAVVALAVVVFGAIYWASMPSTRSGGIADTRRDPQGGDKSDDHLALARDMLSQKTDLTTCDSALKQIDRHLNESYQDRPAGFTDEQRRQLTDADVFGLRPDEVAEVERAETTKLDRQYLETCLLMRDAAQSLSVDGAPPRDQAAAAFAWVTRQVRLSDPKEVGLPLPPSYVLRRGFGTAAERGLIFLALMEQLAPGSPCCLVGQAGMAGDDDPKVWACAVPVEDGGKLGEDGGKTDFLLFDPRLGVPLPATLNEVLADPGVLKKVTVDEKFPYDVNAERVKASALYLAMPLSGLAPRMRFIEAKLREKPETAVRLADPLASLEALKKVAPRRDGKPMPVAVWRRALPTQRGFWAASEGGVDTTNRVGRTSLELVPRGALPPYIERLQGRGQVLVRLFQSEFIEPLANVDGPRDALLRGHTDDATSQLVQLRGRFVAAIQGGGVALLGGPAQQWAADLTEAEREEARLKEDPQTMKSAAGRAQLESATARANEITAVGSPIAEKLVRAIVAQYRINEVTYELALSMQEAAEQLNQPLEQKKRSGGTPTAGELENLKKAWGYSDSWWKECLQKRSPLTAAAQRHHARVLERLGKRDEALTLLRDLSAEMTPLEKTARLYLAKQLEGGGP